MKKGWIIVCFLILGMKLASAQSNGNNSISLYPVPLTTNVLKIDLSSTTAERAATIELRNFIGRKLQTQTLKGGKELEFSEMSVYPEGVYVVIIKDKSGKIIDTAKFMITK